MKWLDAARQYFGLHAPSWSGWLAVIGGALGETLDATQREFFRHVFKRDPLTQACNELWLAIGRRGGKDYVATRLLIYLGLFYKWTLAPGEVGTILLLAVDRAQAKVAFKYLRGALETEPLLWAEVANVTADTIVFNNGIEVQITTSDYAAVRGRTVLAALLDEFAFWGVEQATEVVRALRPAMATQPQAKLIVISSAYASFGPFYEAFRRYHGSDDLRVLFGRATTRDMNPNVLEQFIVDEIARDPRAVAEYLSEFLTDVTNFLDVGTVNPATRPSPREIPYAAMSPDGGHFAYYAGLDVSGGRGDAAACAIGRIERDRINIVALRRWPAPHDPLAVARDVAAFLKSYHLSSAIADAYAAEFATSVYREVGVAISAASVTRTEAYLHMLPAFTTGRIEIPDDQVLRAELLGLERRTGPSGKDTIDHPPHGHDDAANALALATVAASRQMTTGDGAVYVAPSAGRDMALEFGRIDGNYDIHLGKPLSTDWP